MVLVLAVHTVEEVSARIPFCMMVLNDVLSRQQSSVPPGLDYRFLVPTSGTVSVSLWDASDVETLKVWLDETLSEYCSTECFEVVEEFAQGISVELARQRTAQSVSQKTGAAAASVGEKAQEALSATAAKAKEAGQKVGQKFDEIDQKLKIKEKTTKVGSTVGTTTRNVVGKAGNLALQTKDRAMQNKVVASSVMQIGSGVKVGMKAAGSGLSFLTKKLGELGDTVIKSVQELDAEEKQEREQEASDEMLKQALEEEEPQEAEKKPEEYFAGFDDDGEEAKEPEQPAQEPEPQKDQEEPEREEVREEPEREEVQEEPEKEEVQEEPEKEEEKVVVKDEREAKKEAMMEAMMQAIKDDSPKTEDPQPTSTTETPQEES
ncbi:hypothetical protein HOP50_11g64470 [Chloropicon primus]|uniref:Senescence domain-containing protein n=1 Tax=Chloropicon primus TaxID=1764295 RepID=A0A5B8MTK4_9CHLO|nr:hypothetical protein A3770_11p64270 [Chloropicon primus]UPR03120.1 hypothetical protein HOP50_11g64470 [Chloropicon primus]|eukprot:QDZ23909.1 hypothetical protein A3770_11p64270 [Chloropicon primus]